MPRALVTGGTGFVGSHLVTALCSAGWDVRALDRNAPAVPPVRYEFVRGDVRDAEAVARAARGCELVVDNAALVPVSRSSLEQFRAVNVDGPRHCLAAARAEGAHVVHISSSAIYGVPRELPVTESTPLLPFEPYGQSKAEAERLVHRERGRGLRIASLRSRALVGEGRLGLFEVIFRRIRSGRRVPMFGSGEVQIQFCDIEDFCSATLAAVERRASGDYNIGATGVRSVREELQALIDHAGTGARLQPVPVWAVKASLRGLGALRLSPFTAWHVVSSATAYYADLSAAERQLGWRPLRTNAEALIHAYDRWVAAPERYGPSPHTRPLRGAFVRLLRG